MPGSTGLIGAAGEYYVAAELSRRDWLATVTIKNSPGTDVLAQKLDRGSVVAIQTKTASRRNHFILGKKDEQCGAADNEWYVLVGLGGESERPTFYIVPRPVMAAITFLEHRAWLDSVGPLHKPAMEGTVRKSGSMRSIRRPWIDGYRERWDLLDKPASAAPYLGLDAFLELAKVIPLPPDFPPLGGVGM